MTEMLKGYERANAMRQKVPCPAWLKELDVGIPQAAHHDKEYIEVESQIRGMRKRIYE